MLLQRQRAAPFAAATTARGTFAVSAHAALPYASQAGIPRYLNGFQKFQQPQKAGNAKIAVGRGQRRAYQARHRCGAPATCDQIPHLAHLEDGTEFVFGLPDNGVHLLAKSVTHCRCRRCMLASAEGRPLTTPGQ
jgi:hypothetical protein